MVIRKILLTDHSQQDRETYRGYLLRYKQHAYRILEAATGEQALRLCQQLLPDLIVIDYLLPDLNGLEFLDTLKKQVYPINVPVIILTDRGNELVAVQAMKEGAADYLVKKHTTPSSLYSAVENVFTKIHPSQQPDDMDAHWQARQHQPAVATLQESEAHFRQMTNTVPVMIWMSGTDRLCTYLNQTWLNFTGRTLEQEMGEGWLQGVHPDDYQSCLSTYSQAFNTRQDFALEYRLRRFDGEYRWIWNTGVPRFTTGGEFLGYIGSCTDIHHRKQAELALWKTQQQLTAIVNNSPAVIYLIDSQNRHILVNHSYAKLLSATPESLIGKSIYEVWPTATAHAFATNNQQVLQGNQAIEVEEVVPHVDGIHTYITIKFPLQDVHGVPYAVCGISTDISDRKQAQQKIREQAALIDITTDAIFVCDLENRIVFWSRGSQNLYGWTIEESLGKKANEIFNKQLSQLEAALKTTIEHGSWQGELEQITKTGREIIVASRCSLVHDESGKPQSILAVNTDITEKKQLQAQFYHAQRLESLGTLASGIAHDLNNILTPILAVAQLLPIKLNHLDESNQNLLQILENNCKRGAELVKQITTFARGAKGKSVHVQPKHLLKEIEQVIKSTFPKSIEISLDIATPNLWTILADPTQIHQVLMNLCVNARDAMPHGGRLSMIADNFRVDENYARINLEAKVGDYVVITISDTGSGMSPEVIERIFEPFFTTKEPDKGTGLGLSTVIGITKNQGGFVKVHSEVGRGSQFQVYLSATNLLATQATNDTQMLQGRGELILIVDDEAFIRELAKNSLEQFNYRVLIASDSIEAFSLYAQQKTEISLVLMDIQMPSIDGFQAIRILRQMNPAVKIIVLSGLTSNYQLLEANNLEVQAFLPKPYTIKELLDTIRTVLNPNED